MKRGDDTLLFLSQYNMTAHALLFTLAAIGIAETAYLIRKRIAAEKPICFIGHDCSIVLTSTYNKIFGIIHNDIAGFLFYIGISIITAFLVIGIEPLFLWELCAKLMIVAGVILSLFFIYVQWRIIQTWCFWCLMSAFTIFSMAFIVIVSNLILSY